MKHISFHVEAMLKFRIYQINISDISSADTTNFECVNTQRILIQIAHPLDNLSKIKRCIISLLFLTVLHITIITFYK